MQYFPPERINNGIICIIEDGEQWKLGHFYLDDEFVDSILGYAISTLARSFERFVVKTSEQTKNHEIIKRQKGRYWLQGVQYSLLDRFFR